MATAGQTRSAAEVLAKAQTRTGRVRLVLDGDLLDEHARLEDALDAASDGEKREIAEQIVDCEQRLADAEVEFVFRGLGRPTWRKMVADHPPTDTQRAEGADFNVDTFPFEAMAASLVDPAMTADQVRELEEHLDEVQFSTLWSACIRANVGGGVTRPESRAARAIMANGRRSSPQPSGSESPAAS
jgi:hypothetical protein